MKDIRLFLEHRTVDEIKLKCSQTGEEIDPIYVAYDKDSLDEIIQQYKQNKNGFDNLSIFFAYLKGNSWIVKTKINYTMNIDRIQDKFLSSKNVDYSYDDIISLISDDDIMVIYVYNK